MQRVNQFSYIAAERGALRGQMSGSEEFPDIEGLVTVYWLPEGLYLQAEFDGLPASGVFGFHIHENAAAPLEGGGEAFPQAGAHYTNCGDNGIWCDRHPYQAGDLPAVIADEHGHAAMQVYLGKAQVSDISGKTVILHGGTDDFRTQPAGDSGIRIAGGVLAEDL